MKIQTTSKSADTFGNEWLRVSFTAGKKRSSVLKDGVPSLEVGTGDEKDQTIRKFRIVVRKIVEEAKSRDCEKIVLPPLSAWKMGELAQLSNAAVGELIAENLTLADYVFRAYKSKPKDGWKDINEVAIPLTSDSDFEKGLSRGLLIAECVNEARNLANIPGGDMTPHLLAESAKSALKGTKAKVTILKKKEIEKLKMGAILGVSKGSTEEPRFIVIEYKGLSLKRTATSAVRSADEEAKPIVFIGKGITFDSGGLNIKPSDGILDMHLDMSGGAAVIGALKAIAELGIKRNVIGLIPSAENMVSGSSYRPGDILTSMSGKTIDVLNTDAEGRLVLADALTYAKRYKPALVVDVATLTGASLVALGQHASAVMSKDVDISQKIARLGEECGDYMWPLPLWDEFIKYTKGVHGDIANIQSSGNARYGGAINGGAFLTHFTDGYPWAHIDMAPRMVSAPGDHLAKGATGEPVRLLISIAQNYW